MKMKVTRDLAIGSLVLSALVLQLTIVPAAGDTPARESPIKTRTIHFEPGRSYEVTGIWLDPDDLPKLEAYFAEVFPIAAADYGVKPLFSLEPQQAYAGDFMPQVMFVNEWPSLERFRGIRDGPAGAGAVFRA